MTGAVHLLLFWLVMAAGLLLTTLSNYVRSDVGQIVLSCAGALLTFPALDVPAPDEREIGEMVLAFAVPAAMLVPMWQGVKRGCQKLHQRYPEYFKQHWRDD